MAPGCLSLRRLVCVAENPLVALRETNSMVEEFMLLANISVAQKIYHEFPDCAMLRKHPAPPPSNYDILHKASRSKVRGPGSGFPDTTTARSTGLLPAVLADS